MKLIHEKSACCSAGIIRFGGKRRQCVACKKTWRVHPSKRGRKSLRNQSDYLEKVFCHGLSVKQLALHSSLTADAIYKRFGKNLNSVISKKRTVRVRGSRLIIIIDAQWNYFKGKLWTLYFVAVKSVGSDFVIILDPVLKQGKENASTWDSVISQLPPGIKKRTIAMVSDGLRGIETIAIQNGWIIQRCHFHLLSMLQKMRGKRASTPGRLVRQEIYDTVKLVLTEKSDRKLDDLCRRLAFLIQDKECPKKMKMTARDFLRRLPDFRNYLSHPGLKLPTTINVMESNNSLTRRKSRTVNTPQAWLKWATACARTKSKFTCK
jgi:hypothetical protein